MSLKEIIRAASKSMKDVFEGRTRLIPHPAYKGAEREQEVAAFLREYCPKRFSVGSGFVASAKRQPISDQQDIVIYDALNCPLLCPGTISQIFPIESVYATIQVKSCLDKKELKSSLKNIKSVKQLQMDSGITRNTMVASVAVRPPSAPPLGIVFAFQSRWKRLSAVKKNLENMHTQSIPRHWINIVCIHNKGILFYGNPENLRLKTSLDNTCKLAILDDAEDTLFNFYVMLLGHLSIAEERIPNIVAYAGISKNTIQEALDLLE